MLICHTHCAMMLTDTQPGVTTSSMPSSCGVPEVFSNLQTDTQYSLSLRCGRRHTVGQGDTSLGKVSAHGGGVHASQAAGEASPQRHPLQQGPFCTSYWRRHRPQIGHPCTAHSMHQQTLQLAACVAKTGGNASKTCSVVQVDRCDDAFVVKVTGFRGYHCRLPSKPNL